MTVNLAARYVHGEWTALVTGHGTALLDPSIGEEQVQQVWAALSEGRGVSGCLEVLAAGGFANLPSFALVQHGEDELRVLVRGEVEVSAGESTVGAAGIATWREALLPGQSYRVEVAGDGAARPEWPLAGGVVLASRVEWLGSGEAASGAAAGAVATEEGDGSGDEAGDDGDGDPEPAGEPEGEPTPEADAELESEPVAGGSSDADGASAEAVAGVGVGVGVAAPVVAAAVAGSDVEAGEPEAGEPETAELEAADVDDADSVERVGEDAEERADVDPEAADPEDVGEAAAEAPAGVDEFGDAAGEQSWADEPEPDASAEAPLEGADADEGVTGAEYGDAAGEQADGVSAEDAPSGDSPADHDPGDEELAEEIPAAHSPQEAGDDFSADTPDEPSAESGEDAADAEHESAPHEVADPAADVSAHTAEEDSAPSPEEGDPDAAAEVEASDSVDDAEDDADDDYAADAPTLTSSGSDIIDSLPWAVSASDREEARAAQDQAAAVPPDAPAFEAPDAPGFDSPAEPVPPAEAAVPAAADDELPEQTVVSRADAQAPTPAPAQQPSAPAATGGEDDVISFDSLMAQQVPQHPSQEQHEQPEQPGAAFGAPAPAQPAAQPYQAAQPYEAAPAPYGHGFGAPTGGSGYAFGAPADQQPTGSQAPAPWAPPADMAQAGGPAQGQGDVDIEGDHDGETIMVSQLPTGAGSGAAPGTGASDLYDEPHAAPAPSIHLALSTGAHVPLDRPVLIGRAPESARFNAGVQPRLVTVASPEQDISRTHVEVRAEGGHAVVTDLNSTNGTVVIQPGSPPRRLHPGEGASVPAGTVVDLGDGITVTVQSAAQGPG